MMYYLANHLGQPLSTILEMTVSEFQHWLVFLRIKQEKENGSKTSTH
jgi:hypothetical protein